METLREKSSSHLILLHPLGVQPGPFRWVSVSTIYRWCPGWEWDVSFQTPRKCTVCYKPWTEKMFIVLELLIAGFVPMPERILQEEIFFPGVPYPCHIETSPRNIQSPRARLWVLLSGRMSTESAKGSHWATLKKKWHCFVISLLPLQCELSWIRVPKGDFITIGQGKKTKSFSSVVLLVLWEALKMPICKERFCNLSTHHFIRSVSQPIHQSNNEPNKQRR